MELRQVLIVSLSVLSSLVIFCSMEPSTPTTENTNIILENKGGEIIKSSSLVMYDNLEKYSSEYNIPKYIIYNIAYLETTYRGPFDWKYNPSKISCVGAQGPMQVMPSTARLIHKSPVSVEKLRNNIEFNIRTSAMLLEKLFKKYGDWSVVCGCYNTGRPIINGYAKFCTSNLDYQKNWVYVN